MKTASVISTGRQRAGENTRWYLLSVAMAAAGATVTLLTAGPAVGGGGRGGSRAGSVAAAPPSMEPRICSSTAADDEEPFRDRRKNATRGLRSSFSVLIH